MEKKYAKKRNHFRKYGSFTNKRTA